MRHLYIHIRHAKSPTADREASPGPASRPASGASLTAVTDDQQFEEVIVVPGHAGRRCLKPRAFAATSRLAPAERLVFAFRRITAEKITR